MIGFNELRASPVFSTCSEASLRRLLEHATYRTFAADEVVFSIGDFPTHVHVIVEGRVRVFHRDDTTNQATVRHFAAPSVIGHVEILAHTSFANNGLALTPTRVISIEAPRFIELVEADAQLALELFRHTCRLFCVVARQEPFVLCDVERRLGSVLLAYLQGFGRPAADGEMIRFALTQSVLAHDLGANLRSVRRVLSDWTTRGWISMRKGWIVVHARDRIEHVSGRFRDNFVYHDGIAISDQSETREAALGNEFAGGRRPELARLRENPVLADVSAEQLQMILDRGAHLSIPSSTVVIRAGENSDYVDFLVDGQIRVFHEDEAGLQVTVKHLGAPCTLGEMQVMSKLRYVENAETLTAARFVRLPAADFQIFLQQEHRACVRLLRDVSTRMCVAMRHEASILFSVAARMASLFFAYANGFGHTEADGAIVLRFPLTRARIAAELGVTIRSVARVLQEWREESWVITQGDSLQIQNPKALSEVCRGLQYNLRYEAAAIAETPALKLVPEKGRKKARPAA